MSHFDLLKNDDNIHSLLEGPSPPYSSVTIRRALLVWMHTGQQNEFQQVCNYYHRLEALEIKSSEEDRVKSRLHEFHLLSGFPPSSSYLNSNFPNLYPNKKTAEINHIIEKLSLEDCVFNLEGYHDIQIKKGDTTRDIIKISQIIINYCKTHYKSLTNFHAELQDFIKKTKATNTLTNIFMYIKKKYLEDELETWKNLPKTFSFLDITENTKKDNAKKILKNNKHPASDDHNFNANNIRILINESRRKELMNVSPNFSELSFKEHNNNYCFPNPNVQSEKFTNIHQKNSKYNNYGFVRKM